MLIPKFEKPVALRQEMKLVNEGGQEKLIVTNFFETPLDTDLSDLASEMLRRKAKLDVNATPEKVQTACFFVGFTLSNQLLCLGKAGIHHFTLRIYQLFYPWF